MLKLFWCTACMCEVRTAELQLFFMCMQFWEQCLTANGLVMSMARRLDRTAHLPTAFRLEWATCSGSRTWPAWGIAFCRACVSALAWNILDNVEDGTVGVTLKLNSGHVKGILFFSFFFGGTNSKDRTFLQLGNVAVKKHTFALHKFENKANGRKKKSKPQKTKTRQINTS